MVTNKPYKQIAEHTSVRLTVIHLLKCHFCFVLMQQSSVNTCRTKSISSQR